MAATAMAAAPAHQRVDPQYIPKINSYCYARHGRTLFLSLLVVGLLMVIGATVSHYKLYMPRGVNIALWSVGGLLIVVPYFPLRKASYAYEHKKRMYEIFLEGRTASRGAFEELATLFSPGILLNYAIAARRPDAIVQLMQIDSFDLTHRPAVALLNPEDYGDSPTILALEPDVKDVKSDCSTRPNPTAPRKVVYGWLSRYAFDPSNRTIDATRAHIARLTIQQRLDLICELIKQHNIGGLRWLYANAPDLCQSPVERIRGFDSYRTVQDAIRPILDRWGPLPQVLPLSDNAH